MPFGGDPILGTRTTILSTGKASTYLFGRYYLVVLMISMIRALYLVEVECVVDARADLMSLRNLWSFLDQL